MGRKRKPASPEEIAKRRARLQEADAEAARLKEQGCEVYRDRSGEITGAKRVGGLDWLLKKGRIDLFQYRAGEHYSDDWMKGDEVLVRSCLNDSLGGDPEAVQQRRKEAQDRLSSARVLGLGGHAGMISLCDRVAGQGQRIRAIAGENDLEAAKLEAVFVVALDLLAAHYGIVKP